MKILLCCPHFYPDTHAATGEVMTKLVEALAERGHEITVVTALPWYREHKVEKSWKGRPWRTEETAWGKIIRVYPFPTDRTSIPGRAVGFIGFTGLSLVRSLAAGKHDVVMGMSPPIFIGEAAYLASKRSRVPFVFNTQDIFPDVAVELGALNNPKVINYASKYERSLYNRADAITVLSDDQAQNVRSKIADSDGHKVEIIPNFVDIKQIKPVDKSGWYRKQLGIPAGQKVVMYSGNVGLSQSFDLVRSAAHEFKEREDVTFVINGEGAARPEVDAWASHLDNVVVQDFGPKEKLSDILGAADIHLILLKSGLAKSSTPSKLYGILASERPVLASIDEGSEVANVISDAGCGLSVPPDDLGAFSAALAKLLDNTQEELKVLGSAGRSYAETCTTPMMQAEAYEGLFQRLVSEQ